jgi:signal transduction histidine kinase/ActR/RegA family two-component response regulator
VLELRVARRPDCGLPEGVYRLCMVYSAGVGAQGNASDRRDASMWRLHLLEGLLKATAVLMTIVLPALVIQTESYRLDWVSPIALGYVLVLVASFRPRLSYPVRALFLLYALACVALLGFVRVGLQVGPSVGSALVVVVAGLLLGRTALLMAYALMTGGILGVGALHQVVEARWLAGHATDPMLFSNWVRGALAFGLFGGVLAVAVMFVVSRVESMLATRSRALAELEAAQTKSAHAEEALAEANQQILRMQRLEALGRLSGGVAHDFNNALVVILGWTEILRAKQVAPAELEKALGEINTAAESAARLTQQLLSFGRKGLHVAQPVALDELVARFSETLSRLLPENVRVRCEYAREVPKALVDPGQMHQVLLNLCLNARDAMPHGGQLTIAVQGQQLAASGGRPEGEWVSLRVTDTGVGMDAHTLENAFEPFFSTKGEAGSGLGLASVYGIVQQSGGHVSVDSTPGKGTSITLHLPVANGQASKRLSPERGVPKIKPRATILVAEDEPAVRRLMVRALEAEGHGVLEAEDGDAALTLAQTHSGTIDLLCADGVMPGIPSHALIAAFRKLHPNAGVLVCSGHIAEQGLRDSVEANTLGFLAKPFTGTQLSRAVAASLAAEE